MVPADRQGAFVDLGKIRYNGRMYTDMKIKEGFVLRKMPGMNLVMPVGENIKTYKGSVMLNDTGAFI